MRANLASVFLKSYVYWYEQTPQYIFIVVQFTQKVQQITQSNVEYKLSDMEPMHNKSSL